MRTPRLFAKNLGWRGDLTKVKSPGVRDSIKSPQINKAVYSDFSMLMGRCDLSPSNETERRDRAKKRFKKRAHSVRLRMWVGSRACLFYFFFTFYPWCSVFSFGAYRERGRAKNMVNTQVKRFRAYANVTDVRVIFVRSVVTRAS